MMMYKLMLTLPHSAAKACPRCASLGRSIEGGMRWVPIIHQLGVTVQLWRMVC